MDSRIWSALKCAMGSTFLMIGYEMIRNPAYSLFKAEFGVARLPVVMMLIPLVITGVLYLYGASLNRFGTHKTFFLTLAVSGLLIGICYAGIFCGIKNISAALLIVSEIYIVLIIEQCWSFINSLFTANMGKNYNGVVLAISSVGGIIGGLLVHRLAPLIGSLHLLVINMACFLPAAWIFWRGFRQFPTMTPPVNTLDLIGAKAMLKSPLLLRLLTVNVACQVFSTFITLHFQGSLHELSSVDAQTAYSGLVFAVISASAIALQLLASKPLLHLVGPLVVQGMVPILLVAMMVILLFAPSLTMSSLAFGLFKALDYSLFRASKEIFYIPMDFNARYRAKELIDVLGFRGSKGVLSGGMSIYQVAIGTLSLGQLSTCGFISAVCWALSFIPLRKAFLEETTEEPFGLVQNQG